jgi:ABC-type Zn uptake system ZnuABC Zn-binding protein ZnuA
VKKRPGIGCFSCALTIATLACAPHPATAEPLNVVATIHPLAAIVDAVGGDSVRTSTLLPPGASPHAYDPVPSDLVRLSRADLLVTVGGGLDSWADRLRTATESEPMVLTLTALNQGRTRPEDDHHDHDHHDEPHLWLDPLFVADTLVPAIAQAITSAGIADTEALAARSAALTRDLHALDKRIRRALAGAGATEYIAFHNAWGHFAARYELDELGVLEEAGGEEPTPRAIAGIIRAARAHGVGAILVEPQLPPRVAEIIAAEFAGSTVVVDPIGSPVAPGRSGYIELMDYNGQAFTRALALRKNP